MVVSHSNFYFRLEILAEHVKAAVLALVMCLEFLSNRSITIVIFAWVFVAEDVNVGVLFG